MMAQSTDNDDSSSFESSFIQNQKELSSQIKPKDKGSSSQEEFTLHQQNMFNEMASAFRTISWSDCKTSCSNSSSSSADSLPKL